MSKWQELYDVGIKHSDPVIREKLVRQSYRMRVEEKISNCQACPLGVSQNYRAQIVGPTPCFLAFVHEGPAYGHRWPINVDQIEIFRQLLKIVGHTEEQVAIMGSICCPDPGYSYPVTNPCRDNLEWQMGLSGARVFVLLGEEVCKRVLYPVNMNDAHGSWRMVLGANGDKRYYFLARRPSQCIENKKVWEEMKADYNSLGKLLHMAWVEHMVRVIPGASRRMELDYDGICDLVAGMIKHYLMNLRPGERTETYMQIMTRMAHVSNGEGNVIRAFWDDEFARKVGVDIGKGESDIRGLGVRESWSGWIP